MVASLTAKHLSIHINSCSTDFASLSASSLTPNQFLSNSWKTSIRPLIRTSSNITILRQLDPPFPTTLSLVLDTTPICSGLYPIQMPLNGQPSNIALKSHFTHSSTSTQTSETREQGIWRDGKDGGMNEQTTWEREVVVEEAITLEGEEITRLLTVPMRTPNSSTALQPLVMSLWPSSPSSDHSQPYQDD